MWFKPAPGKTASGKPKRKAPVINPGGVMKRPAQKPQAPQKPKKARKAKRPKQARNVQPGGPMRRAPAPRPSPATG